MRLFVGVTDFDWYQHLSARLELDEVNFWSPSSKVFKALRPGELFLLKLKAVHGHPIVGGGIFAHDTLLPISMAWLAFGEKNGAASLGEMRTRIRKYQSDAGRQLRDPVIGCRLLQQPFFFPREHWFKAPESFRVNTVSGKGYNVDDADGAELYRMVQERLPWSTGTLPKLATAQPGLAEQSRYGAPQTVFPRLGQGSFRVAVLDGFDRRCVVTGERTLPILDVAHIRPWALGGENQPGNGLLLRTDVHRLFDLGYVTVNHQHRFEVSPRLKEDYENGRVYYALHGQPIRAPRDPSYLPSQEALDWHHANRWSRPGEYLAR